MKTIVVGLLSLFLSQIAFASGPDWMLGSSLNNAVVYVQAGADVVISSGQSVQILSRTTSTPKTFYLDLVDMEAALNTISATAAPLGTCSLQIPAGATTQTGLNIMTWNFQNTTNSQVDRHFFQLSHAIAVPTSFAINCKPVAATSSYWNINYTGVEY